MGVKKPGLWRFMLRLADTYDYYKQRYIDFLGGRVDVKKGNAEEDRQTAIQRTVRRFNELSPKDYLYAIVKVTSC